MTLTSVQARMKTNDLVEHWLEKYRSFSCSSSTISLEQSLDIKQLWNLMDRVWDEIGCDSNDPDSQKISEYYQHPIWLLNGSFTESDPLSISHRKSISTWVSQQHINSILDFGGGFGTLARMISDATEQVTVDICEPYPSDEARSRCQNYPRIKFVNALGENYECLVSTDVLEHVPDPLKLFAEMIAAVKQDGYLVIANHFYPCIKCHLPTTFHLRYSFDRFAEMMGLEVVGPCEGSHATIYRKSGDVQVDWKKLRRMELKSRFLFPLRELYTLNLMPWPRRLKLLLTQPKLAFEKAKQKI